MRKWRPRRAKPQLVCSGPEAQVQVWLVLKFAIKHFRPAYVAHFFPARVQILWFCKENQEIFFPFIFLVGNRNSDVSKCFLEKNVLFLHQTESYMNGRNCSALSCFSCPPPLATSLCSFPHVRCQPPLGSAATQVSLVLGQQLRWHSNSSSVCQALCWMFYKHSLRKSLSQLRKVDLLLPPITTTLRRRDWSFREVKGFDRDLTADRRQCWDLNLDRVTLELGLSTTNVTH